MTQRSFVLSLLWALAALAESPSVQSITLTKLKADPLKYDGKTVQVKGWLTSGHVGVFCYDEAKENSVRVRAAEEVPSISRTLVRRDNAYTEFWRQSGREISKDARPGIHVEFQALVRLLKVNGKPAKEFSVLGQFPIELVPIRVLAVESRR